MTEHAADQEALAAVPELESAAAAPTTGWAPSGAGALAAAMGNQAFGTQYGGGAAGIEPSAMLANAGSVLARALFADPSQGTRAPWTSLRSEAEQSRANLATIGPLSVDRQVDDELGAGLASAVASRQTVARQDHPPGGGTPAVPPAPQWETFFTGDTLAGIRAGLEISRVWPGVGAWTGLASDVAGTVSDIATINQEDAPILKTVIAIRGILNAVNNFVGHIGYVQELGSKVAAVSVIGAWLTPILDSIGLALKDLKLLLDLALGLIDVGIWAAAEQQKLHATTPESAGRWNNLIGGYQANMIGDLATLLVDGWDAATATEGDGEVAKQAVYSMKGLMQAARKFGPILLNWIMGLFNVYGSKVTTPTMPAQATPDAGGGGNTPPTAPPAPGGAAPSPTSVPAAPAAPPGIARMFSPSVARFGEGMGEGAQSAGRQALSMAIVAELQQAKLGYLAADAALSAGGTAISTIMQQQREQMTALLGGTDPFVFIRDAGVQMTKMLADKAGQLEQAAVLSASATERADQLRSACDSILGFLDSLNVPQVDIPGVGFLVDELRGAVNEVKSMGRGPVETVKNHADEVGEFLQIFADIARQQVAAARTQIQSLSEGLAKCNSFEDVINLFMGKLQEILGTGTNLQIDDIKAYWASIGGKIDEGIVWAQGLASDNPPDPPDPGPAADGAPPESAAAAGGAAGAAAGAAAAPAGAGAGGAGAAAAGGAGAAGSAGAAAVAGAQQAQNAQAASGAASAAAAAGGGGAAAGGAAAAAQAAQNGAAGGAAGGGAAGAAQAAQNGAAGGAAGGGAAGAAQAAVDAAQNGGGAGAGAGQAAQDGAAGGAAAGGAAQNGAGAGAAAGGGAAGAAGGQTIEERLAAAAAARN